MVMIGWKFIMFVVAGFGMNGQGFITFLMSAPSMSAFTVLWTLMGDYRLR